MFCGGGGGERCEYGVEAVGEVGDGRGVLNERSD